jgi:hypothetical protein
MPPVPAHNRAWRGSPVMLELQREGTSRLRVFTHDNEYIGLLRERVARHMACSAKNVRMITMGEFLLLFSLPSAWPLVYCGVRQSIRSAVPCGCKSSSGAVLASIVC